jgi:hypothetical protein
VRPVAPLQGARAACILLLLLTGRAAAQAPEPPGPWVLDLRGATSALPSNTAFFPVIPVDTLVPSRAFGFDVGAHVYLFGLGPARVGIGTSYLRARGTAATTTAEFAALAPQISFNFGSTNGWSYLSAGAGRAWMTTTADQAIGSPERESAGAAVNFGGGARWFLRSWIGVGFDLRWHRLSGTPRATLMSVGVGFSIH